ncbi:M50 family metallopeptidase [Paenibacillus sp. MBLB4367]|uniref:M50 family metallopeptidase n=1 Tax=Paenibacillus sp. MBLB4367 TaxID=3384767 RepID=UPI003907EA09
MIRAFGTAYRFHPLFVLMMVVSLLSGHFVEMLTLFSIVLVHELGHMAAARGFGWRVKEVQLLPFGGVVVVEESGNLPAREEMLVALAGPLQNVWMIAFAFGMKMVGWPETEWWDYFIKCNAMIALFNLLPVSPLDGGKVMQALLSYAMSYHRTLLCCTVISLFMSVVMITGSLFHIGSGGGVQLNLLAIGVFLFYSNWYGYKSLPYQFVRFLLSRENRASSHVRKGTVAEPIIVSEDHRIGDIMQLFMREKYHLVYVIGKQGTIERVLPEQRLIQSFFSPAGNIRIDAIPT